MTDDDFRALVRQKGKELYRPMPWRDQPTLYYVLVSELMLQQTQVARVLPKFAAFVQQFPNFETLAAVDLGDVLRAWQGLGYNRRAKYLHEAARLITAGAPTRALHDLVKLPGIGTNTAAAIMNYVQQTPTPFVETNIRTVYLNYFFTDETIVSDRQILELVARTLDVQHPRYWFWALMDYGAALKNAGKGKLHHAAAHKKQSKFHGSFRQMRGEILRRQARGETITDIMNALSNDPRFTPALESLQKEGLLIEERSST